jgi:hypothetical protein
MGVWAWPRVLKVRRVLFKKEIGVRGVAKSKGPTF